MFKDILQRLYNGDASCLTQDVIFNTNQIVLSLLGKPVDMLTSVEKEVIGDILHISNIIYNNTDRSILVLEDGIYDLLLEKHKKYNPNYQVGAEPIQIQNSAGSVNVQEVNNNYSIPKPAFVKYNIDRESMFFYENLMRTDHTVIEMPENRNVVSKRLRNTAHKYPQLVGTLDKAKFTLDCEAREKGVYENDNVQIFERDFLRKHVQEGYVDPNNITLVLELKYDGVSVEGEVTDQVLSARTRGDTGIDKASDITPILAGYPFVNAKGYKIEPFGMKFEAIINKYNLHQLCVDTGKNYANARNAIIGIFGSSNAAQLAKYITLVPLATSHDNMNRVEEIEFMNKYYATGEGLRYAVVTGNYESVLFQVKRFVEEAEAMRDILPFMYDGVVVSYLDPAIRKALGRKNSVNRYSIAIKFNTKKKQTRIRNITYTVGANGDITPMLWYDPVEFFGNVQTKSSGHSYGRFMELCLKPGDVIDIEYTNDVMAYINKANVEENYYNPNPFFQFIQTCPECGMPLSLSESGLNVTCENLECPGRVIARLTNMVAKLGFKGFSEESIKKLKLTSFHDLMNIDYDRAFLLGDANGDNLMQAIRNFLTTPVMDYTVIGALGFDGIAATKWKAILKSVSLRDIIKLNEAVLLPLLSGIKGIGYKTAGIIVKQRNLFMKDLLFIHNNMTNVISSNGNESSEPLAASKVIRFSGIRDAELMMRLSSMGHDCSEGSVTKATDILLIPFAGYTSGNVEKATKYGTKIIPIQEFYLNQSTYLGDC